MCNSNRNVPVEQSNVIYSVFNFKKTSWKQRGSLYLDLYKIDRYGQVDMWYISLLRIISEDMVQTDNKNILENVSAWKFVFNSLVNTFSVCRFSLINFASIIFLSNHFLLCSSTVALKH